MVIFSPHPRAKKVTNKCVQIMRDVLAREGAPADIAQCIEQPSIALTQELMKRVDLVIATGGRPMVKSAYSSGTPAYGSGVGNATVIIDDTANTYVNGVSEEILGNVLGAKRQYAVISGKVGFPVETAAHPGDPNCRGLSRRHILLEVENSLRRLNTDWLDICYLHVQDANTPLEESLRAMDDLVRSGKVRYVGLSNYAAWRICDAHWIARENHLNGPVAAQMVYNLLTRGIEPELLPLLKEKNIGLCTFNPLAGGFLTGKYTPGVPAPGTRFATSKAYVPRYWYDENFRALHDLTQIASDTGCKLPELSFRWLLSQELVDSVVVGFSRSEQLEENLNYFDEAPLDPGTLARCDRVWSGLAGNRFPYHRTI